MATPTYTPIASITLGSSASSVTFSSIPQDYRDLVLVAQVFVDAGLAPIMRFNNDSGNNYPGVFMRGIDGGTATGATTYNQVNLGFSGETPTSHGMHIAQVMDYSVTDKHKTVLVRSRMQDNRIVEASAARWANTSAITEIDILPTASSFATGTTFALYGIAS